jgi:hypothetical protein
MKSQRKNGCLHPILAPWSPRFDGIFFCGETTMRFGATTWDTSKINFWWTMGPADGGHSLGTSDWGGWFALMLSCTNQCFWGVTSKWTEFKIFVPVDLENSRPKRLISVETTPFLLFHWLRDHRELMKWTQTTCARRVDQTEPHWESDWKMRQWS